MLAAFTKETGIKVVYDVYDNNEIVETKLLAGGSGYDVVVPSAPNVARLIQAGTLQKLDKSKIPNLVNAWPAITDRLAAYDPGNEYAVNYMWGTTGFGYNVDKIAARMPDAPVELLGHDLRPRRRLEIRRLRRLSARHARGNDPRCPQLSPPQPGFEGYRPISRRRPTC